MSDEDREMLIDLCPKCLEAKKGEKRQRDPGNYDPGDNPEENFFR